MIECRSGIDSALQSARKEHARAEDDLAEESRKLEAFTGSAAENGHSLAALSRLLQRSKADDHAARRKLAEAAIADHDEILAERLSLLRPWRGDADALATLALPEAEQIALWRSDAV